MVYRTWRFQTVTLGHATPSGKPIPARAACPPIHAGDKRKPEQPAGTVFGVGGVRLTTQGTFEISMGIKHDRTDNPTLPQRARRRTTFDMGQDIRVNLNAKVGEKIDFDINYDSQEAFDMEARKIKLAYQGDEDEIIRHLEAGNVNMTTRNSLIDAGEALFGVRPTTVQEPGRIQRCQRVESTVNSQQGTQVIPFEIAPTTTMKTATSFSVPLPLHLQRAEPAPLRPVARGSSGSRYGSPTDEGCTTSHETSWRSRTWANAVSFTTPCGKQADRAHGRPTEPTPCTISWSPGTRVHGSYPKATSFSPGGWWRETTTRNWETRDCWTPRSTAPTAVRVTLRFDCRYNPTRYWQ